MWTILLPHSGLLCNNVPVYRGGTLWSDCSTMEASQYGGPSQYGGTGFYGPTAPPWKPVSTEGRDFMVRLLHHGSHSVRGGWTLWSDCCTMEASQYGGPSQYGGTGLYGPTAPPWKPLSKGGWTLWSDCSTMEASQYGGPSQYGGTGLYGPTAPPWKPLSKGGGGLYGPTAPPWKPLSKGGWTLWSDCSTMEASQYGGMGLYGPAAPPWKPVSTEGWDFMVRLFPNQRPGNAYTMN